MRSFALLALSTLLLVSVLGGYAYAHWNDTLAINGSVSTGHLEWDYIGWDSGRNTNTVMDFNIDASVIGDGPGNTGIIEIRLVNVYPNAFGLMFLKVRNEGTIPVHVTFVVNMTATGTLCQELMQYVLLNPYFDAPYYGAPMDLSNYGSDWVLWGPVYQGWTDPWTLPVATWDTIGVKSLENISASGQVLKVPQGSTVMQYDIDAIIEPGEAHVIPIWIGISDEAQEHEELMDLDCDIVFTILYTATQAVP